MKNPLSNPFDFEGHDVRVAIGNDSEIWYCAKDVCDVLGIGNPAESTRNLDDDEAAFLDLFRLLNPETRDGVAQVMETAVRTAQRNKPGFVLR